MNTKALFQIPYGLYLLSARDDNFDNACIINTLTQVTDRPNRISVCVNRNTLTHDMILRDGVFTVSMLSSDAPFSLIERFGFSSGRDRDKFRGFGSVVRTSNGTLRLTQYTNAYLSGSVFRTVDLGTHTIFLADMTDAGILSDLPTMTYTDYHARVKPRKSSEVPAQQSIGYRCTVCGYLYEGADLPEDFVCPVCHHGAEDFEKVEPAGVS